MAGVVVALLSVDEGIFAKLQTVNLEESLRCSFGDVGYQLLGVGFFAALGIVLYRIATREDKQTSL